MLSFLKNLLSLLLLQYIILAGNTGYETAKGDNPSANTKPDIIYLYADALAMENLGFMSMRADKGFYCYCKVPLYPGFSQKCRN